MGIYARYDLSCYAAQRKCKEPTCAYSIDSYQVLIYDTQGSSEITHDFATWQEVFNYMDRFFADEFYDEWNYRITGLVYN